MKRHGNKGLEKVSVKCNTGKRDNSRNVPTLTTMLPTPRLDFRNPSLQPTELPEPSLLDVSAEKFYESSFEPSSFTIHKVSFVPEKSKSSGCFMNAEIFIKNVNCIRKILNIDNKFPRIKVNVLLAHEKEISTRST